MNYAESYDRIINTVSWDWEEWIGNTVQIFLSVKWLEWPTSDMADPGDLTVELYVADLAMERLFLRLGRSVWGCIQPKVCRQPYKKNGTQMLKENNFKIG